VHIALINYCPYYSCITIICLLSSSLIAPTRKEHIQPNCRGERERIEIFCTPQLYIGRGRERGRKLAKQNKLGKRRGRRGRGGREKADRERKKEERETMEVGLKMEETELSLGLGLGLPGGGGEMMVRSSGVGSKRGFSETVDLKLNLTTTNNNSGAKDQTVTSPPMDLMKNDHKAEDVSSKITADPARPPAK